MKIDSLIEITARLSDAQELLERGRVQDAYTLLDGTKRELFLSEWRDEKTDLPFQDWCKANGVWVNFGEGLEGAETRI